VSLAAASASGLPGQAGALPPLPRLYRLINRLRQHLAATSHRL